MIDKTNWKLVRRIFVHALALSSSRRPAFLKEQCDGDDGVREEVESLLEFAESPHKKFEGAGVQLEMATAVKQFKLEPPATDQLPKSVGPFVLREELGRGGMGTVYLSEQSEPFRRFVALKVVRAGLDSASVLQRFGTERSVLARFNHPNIAQVFDAGETPDGRPYIAMEFVPGSPITDHCDERGLRIEQRLELLERICHAVHHCHLRGIIHRDLKPSNLMVAIVDGEAIPKIIDFGIAKAFDGDGLSDGRTRQGQFIGTPEYSSPEQLAGNGDIDVRSDVYALGVVLHELLVGDVPNPGDKDVRPSDYSSTDESTQAESASKRGTTPRRLIRRLKRDLDWVVLKAMSKKRDERYSSALELANELERARTSQPTLAGPQGPMDRAFRFARRHRAALTTASIILLGVAIGFAGLRNGVVQAKEAESRARSDADSADRVTDFVIRLFSDAVPSPETGGPVTVKSVVEVAALDVQESFADDPRGRARLLSTLAAVLLRTGVPERAIETAENAISAWKESGRVKGEDLGELWADLAQAHLAVGDWESADTCLIQARAALPTGLDPHAPAQALILLTRAKLLYAQNSLDESESILLELRSWPQPQRRAQKLLGELYVHTGRYAEAELELQAHLQEVERLVPAGHPSIADALDSLGDLCARQGLFAEAVANRRRALEIREELLGAAHPMIGDVVLGLGEALAGIGKTAEAEQLLDRAVAIYQVNYGSNDVRTAIALAALAKFEAGEGRSKEAFGHYNKVLPILRRELGDDNLMTLGIRHNYGKALLNSQNFVAALELFEGLYSASNKALGVDHPLPNLCMINIGISLGGLNQYEQAAPILEEAVVKREELFGFVDNAGFFGIGVLSRLLLDLGEFERAHMWATKAKQLAEARPVGDPGRLNTEPTADYVLNALEQRRAIQGNAGE